ncbi:ROK family transcriptional regulator [Nocardioides sp. 1609]|uniref:ROK family transcriptional regulator n=1 Tax=Nocardioides sp. 1609 TaxID=2508327 RepID=UPI00142F9C35|nr:ROK family transcriptional regulator [Nocardioides sp. 1609]
MGRELGGAVLRRLRDAGPQTKTQLAEALGVSRTTLSAAVRALVDEGHVEDGPLAASSGGRRSTSVRLSSGRVVVALSLGERRVRVAVIDGHLTITTGVSIDLRDRDVAPGSVPGVVLQAVRQLLADRRPTAFGCAVAVPGSALFDELRRGLDDRHPGVPVAALPAVRAMAVGERHSGAARAVDDLLAVRLGNGVTTASVAGGRLAAGDRRYAGRVGHLRVEEFGPACACGRTGCLDSYASGVALVAQAGELARRGRSAVLAATLAGTGELDLADVVAAAQAGDPAVVQLARDAGQRLGQVVAGLVAHTDPRCVVLGGPVAALGGHLLGDLRATVYRLAPAEQTGSLQIVLSEMGERAVLVGAGAGAWDAWIDERPATASVAHF